MDDVCKKTLRNIPAYMDGELPVAERSAAREHLSSCNSCSAELQAALAAESKLRELPPGEPGPFFSARVMAAVRALNDSRAPLRRFLSFPVPAAALLTAFIFFNLFTFAFNINAMENGPRRELTRKVVAQLAKPASLINPLAVARLCGECSKYMCLCMHEAGKKSICPCKDCEMERQNAAGAAAQGGMDHMEGK